MESMQLRTTGSPHLRFVSDEDREGLLGKLGAKQTYDAETFVCPDCGLSRVYAALGDDRRTDAESADAEPSGADSSDADSPDASTSESDEDEGWTFE